MVAGWGNPFLKRALTARVILWFDDWSLSWDWKNYPNKYNYVSSHLKFYALVICVSLQPQRIWGTQPSILSFSSVTSFLVLVLSSVSQLSYWHSHHLLMARWIYFLQKRFAPCQSQGCSHLPGHFSPLTSDFNLPFASHTCFCLQSLHLCSRLQSTSLDCLTNIF